MQTPEQMDDHIEKWRELSTRGKAEAITVFLNECGEHITWDQWRAFLHNHQVKGFEWEHRVSSLPVVEEVLNENL